MTASPRLVAQMLVLFCVLVTRWSHAEDLPAAVVDRPATLPHGMIASTFEAAYEHERVLGVLTRHNTDLVLAARWGVTSRFELALASAFVMNPDTRWSQEGVAYLTYHAWRRGALELAPLATVPVSVHAGADVTSTIVLGPNLRWRASDRVLVSAGRGLLPIAIRPAAAFGIALDGAVAVQLAPRMAALAQVAVGELTLVGQIDRSVAPWHHLMSSVGVLYATPHRIDVALELHGDALHLRDELGVGVAVTGRI